MAARFSPQDVLETEVKRRLGPHVQRRGDGFTEAESMGLLQLVRARWRDGWDVIAQLHNAQFAKHNRSADSLKKKFSRLYRANIPPRGAKNHQAITFAHVVHKEMVEGVPPAPGSVIPGVDSATPVDSSEASFQPTPADDRDGAESEHGWEDTAAEVPSAVATTTVATAAPSAVPIPASVATPPPAVTRPLARASPPTTDWQNPAAVFPPEATPLPTDDLLTSVLKVVLRSQYQRDLDREEERQRRDEERQRRREEAEQRRQEEERRRDEEREERRHRNEERAEERAENRRRHEQFMQMMMLLVGKNGSPQPRDTEC
ncbi:hypothetical protein DVH05_012117 [Phytophthora capsici]|nr:hypothetical protein DVH05_012117 [Phytophthora capsici]